jgi:DNA replication protein DnaC
MCKGSDFPDRGNVSQSTIELDRALKQLRLGGMAAVLETRLRQVQTEPLAPIDLISCLVSDELARRGERLLERRKKQAQFRDSQKTLDNFDFNFNKKMNRGQSVKARSVQFCIHMVDADLIPAGRAGEAVGVG